MAAGSIAAGGAQAIPGTARTTAPSDEPAGRSARSGTATPSPAGGAREGALARLDRLVQTLVERYRAACAERDALRGELAEREERIRSLDARLAELTHSREEAGKRLGLLLERVDRLDAEMASHAGSGASSARE